MCRRNVLERETFLSDNCPVENKDLFSIMMMCKDKLPTCVEKLSFCLSRTQCSDSSVFPLVSDNWFWQTLSQDESLLLLEKSHLRAKIFLN